MAVRKPKVKNTIEKKNRKLTRKDIHAAAKRLKNWGRWGKDDEIGTLNFVTPDCIVNACQLIAGSEGLFRFELVFVLNNQDVGKIHTGGHDVNHHFT